MAAIIDTRSLPTGPARRPELRLVPGGRSGAPSAPQPLVTPAGLVAFVVVALVLAFGALALGRGALAGLAPSGPSAATAPAASAGERTVTVAAGDTMWSIARRLRPTGDVRPLVDQLVAANGGSAIQAGDRLVVPS